MKKVIAKIISVLLKASIPIISACIGIKLCESFNLFQIFQIIADPEKAFDVCMTAYIAIFDLMLHSFTDWIRQKFLPLRQFKLYLVSRTELYKTILFRIF